MEFEEFSKEAVKQIDKQLSQLLQGWRSEVGKIDAKLLPLVNKFIMGCQGGKRIRGMLVVLGYEIAAGGDHLGGVMASQAQPATIRGDLDGKAIFKVAASYEIFHSAILVHDDVIDQSLFRRNKPSLYQTLGGNHYGIAQAISLGDAGFFLAIKIISESLFPEKYKVEALRWFSQTMLDTAMGEMLDVEKGDVTTIMKLKTAKYSVSGPLVLGAILGGTKSHLGGVKALPDRQAGHLRGEKMPASQRGERLHLRGELSSLAKFGENLGVAFQIQDDILGVFGSEEILGKSVTSDIEEGKNTTLFEYALKNADRNQKEILEKLYGKGKIRSHGLEVVRRIFKETGALNYAKNEAKKYKNRAMKILPEITKDKTMSKLLQQMAEYLVARSK